MPKTINFNSINRPYLRLIMQDDAQTTIDVTTPTEAMVEELTATAPELEDVLKTMDANSIRAVYDLAARLISCNLMGLPVTVDDLRGKYRMNLDSLIVLFSAYVEFIEELTKAKN